MIYLAEPHFLLVEDLRIPDQMIIIKVNQLEFHFFSPKFIIAVNFNFFKLTVFVIDCLRFVIWSCLWIWWYQRCYLVISKISRSLSFFFFTFSLNVRKRYFTIEYSISKVHIVCRIWTFHFQHTALIIRLISSIILPYFWTKKFILLWNVSIDFASEIRPCPIAGCPSRFLYNIHSTMSVILFWLVARHIWSKLSACHVSRSKPFLDVVLVQSCLF